jgi:3-oxoadipate CoA-transferase beta subunit
MEHNSKDGSPRLRKACSLPLTAARCVKRVYTNLAVLDVTADGFVVREIVEGLDLDALQRLTEAELALANDWRKLAPPAV